MRRIVAVWLCVIGWGLLTSPTFAQESTSISQCADVSYLMQQNKTPYDFTLGGGALENGAASGTLTADYYADFWSFQVGDAGSIDITFDAVSGSPLEFALYQGMYPLNQYQPVESGQTTSFEVTAGLYTLVIRRVHISDPAEASYDLTVNSPSLQGFTPPSVLNSNGQPYDNQPRTDGGLTDLTVTGIEYRTHPGAVTQVNEQRTDGSQVYFPNRTFSNPAASSLYTWGWTQNIALLGGDLAINNGTDRIFFLESYDFTGPVTGGDSAPLLLNVRFPDDTVINIASDDVYGLWIADDCTGVKLKDGRSFVAETAPENREIVISGTLDQFALRINALNRNNELVPHMITMSWNGVRPDSEVSLLGGTLTLLLVGERELGLQSTEIMLLSQPPGETFPGRVDATLADLGSQVILDWYNMRVFRLANDVIDLEFLDAPRGATTRPGVGVQLFEALSDVIRIVYQPQDNLAGEERLMLPAQDSYLEIITPAGDPAFDGRALPDQDGFAARSLNNLGGECYPVTNIIPQANCAPNGTPNAANGNLWLAMTDVSAHGSWIDLALTRSYNSRGTRWTGPFGVGWSTAFLLDYDVAYDPTTNSRPITSDENYRVALDVRYAPRGLLTFISPTGSQHPFVRYDDGTNQPETAPEEFRAITMPGWTLMRASIRAPWELRQDDGLTYQFDRAGRLLRYGYPLVDRMIEIAYPRTVLDGSGSLGMSTPIFITDDSSGAVRRLELYYNAEHHVVRSVIRDLTNGEPASLADCDPAQNCFEAIYSYDNDRLTEVLYSDGQLATYSYDEAGHLLQQSDPHGPLAPQAIYTYSETGDITSVTLSNGRDSLLWRSLSYEDTSNQRLVTVTDEHANTRTYTYTRLPDALRRERQDGSWQGSNRTTFILLQETSPLTDVDAYERAPQTYLWEDGLLVQVNTRAGLRQSDGRLSYDFNYTRSGKLYCISCDYQGLPELRGRFVPGIDPNDPRVRPENYLLQSLAFTDGSSLAYEYDSRRFITRMTDRNGATYVYTWSTSEPVVLEQVRRENDGVVWEYTYNAVGLMRRSIERHEDEDAATAYSIDYVWDGLGRLITVTDSQMGPYTIAYGIPTQADDGAYITEIILTDPIGAQTVRRYDTVGRLLESRLQDASGFLRRETYTYDLLGRLTEEARWLTDQATGVRPLRTTYTYQPQETIDVTGLVLDVTTVTIRGERIEVVDPSGTQRIYIYDALDRLRETFDETQRRSYYDYSTSDTQQNFGLKITQYEKLSGIATVNVNTFRFDSRWQLIGLERGQERWTLYYSNGGISTRAGGLNSSVSGRTVTLQEASWTWAENSAFPESVLITQAPIELNSRYDVDASHVPNLEFSYDFLGRPLRITDGADVSSPVVYCPQANGRLLTIYGQPNAETVSCDAEEYQAAVVTDMHNRLIEYRDSFGTRQFSYTPNTSDTSEWVVTVQLNDPSGESFTWEMRYNAAGDLVNWLDETNVSYAYTHDALGRLTSVTVADQPEASFTFRYNDANRLTEMNDGLNRGTLFNYNETEQVISQLDARTADAISYAYTPTGQLAAVVSPVGNAMSFLYQDPTNPTRPTAIIDPTGNQHLFQWDDAGNSLIYTNPLNTVTRYRFDGTGLLWRIDDPLVVVPDPSRPIYRSHELRYDSDGRLTDWLFDVRLGQAPAQQLTVARDSVNMWSVRETQGDTNWSESLMFAPSGELVQVGDVSFAYDPLARLRQIETAGQTWDLDWTSGAAEVLLSDPFDLETLIHYDALDRAIRETVEDVETTYSYVSDPESSDVTLVVNRPGLGERTYVLSSGNARSSTPPTITLLAYGQRTQYIFNGDGLLIEILSEICTDEAYATWDECGAAQRSSETAEAVSFWTTRLQFFYDADQRPIRVVDQDGTARTFAYDDADNLITYQTASGRTYSYAYDAAQRLISLTSATGVKLLFGYDTRDNLLGICRTRIDFSNDYAACATQENLTGGSGLLESYGYDALDRLVRRSFPTQGGVTDVPYEYDTSGLLTAIGGTRFTYDEFEQLSSVETGDTTYAYNYHTLNQLVEAGDLEFRYDETGRVIEYTSGGQTFELIYGEDNVYTLQDQDGHRIQYGLDQRGFLSGLDYDDQNVILLGYAYDEREPGIDILWNAEEPTSITHVLNQAKETQSQSFLGAGDFTVFYDLTPTGLVQRQDMTLLPGRSEGYIVVQGYDNDERPLTMRVTDSAGLQVLYTQTITYNTAGLRTGEQLQYADGTRVIKALTYQNNSQLVSQEITIIRPLQTAAAISMLLPLALLRRRRGRILVAALLLGVIALPLIQAQTPQTEERYQFTYTYDDRGNLRQVNLNEPAQTCAQYTYDAANRLTRVQRGDAEVSYGYDAYDRVTRLEDASGITTISYQGTTDRILSVRGAQQTTYLQTANQPAFAALDPSGATTWLITDGRERISQTFEDSDNPRKDLWLFDLLGRALTLQPPTEDETFNPCMIGGERIVPESVRLQSDPKGMVWDAVSGVYFFQGRAYDPESGRYLQRDPQGPDMLGNVYDAWTRQSVPIARQDTPVYAEGLSVLREAMSSVRINEQLTAEAVKARYLPTGSRTITPLTSLQQQARQPFDRTVNGLANLPLWLQSNYNLPAPNLGASGQFVMPQTFAPGQGGTRTPFTDPYNRSLPAWDALAMASIVSPLDSFADLARPVMQPPTPGLTVYESLAWMPQILDLSSLLERPIPPVDRRFTPESVLDLLPRTLAAPELAAYTLDEIDFLYSLPNRPAHVWISEALDQALPTTPDLPPQTLDQWKQDWFTEDLFGLSKSLRPSKPPLPFIPFYEWGDNPDWLHVLR